MATKNNRLSLHQELVDLLGSNNVYFQPPESIKMKYPCFVYERDGMNAKLADDEKYTTSIRYQLIYISKNPDTNDFIQDVLKRFKYIRYDRHMTTENLNHEYFSIYY